MCVYFEYSWITVHTFVMHSHLCVYMHIYYVCTDLGVCGGDVLI